MRRTPFTLERGSAFGLLPFARHAAANLILRPYYRLRHTPIQRFPLYELAVAGKNGAELGNQSAIFMPGSQVPLYDRPASIEAFPPPDILDGTQRYDFILAANQLDRLRNPLKALRSIARILHSGGSLILTIPCRQMSPIDQPATTPFSQLFAADGRGQDAMAATARHVFDLGLLRRCCTHVGLRIIDAQDIGTDLIVLARKP